LLKRHGLPMEKKIAINIGDTFNSGIYILDIENGSVDQAIEGKFQLSAGFDFNWSPNGNIILFDVLGSMMEQLYLFELSSKKMTIISAGEKRISGYGGLWSPSGDYVAYITSSGKPPLPNPSILNIQNISTQESIQIDIPGDGWISFVSWISP
jgi:Tol biopolymer transport system component